MKALLAAISIALGATIALILPGGGSAVLLCAVCALAAGFVISRVADQKNFLLLLFATGLLVRVFIGALIYAADAQDFFGGDARTYDSFGYALLQSWHGNLFYKALYAEWAASGASGWGMLYIVALIYSVVGRNPLAVQFFNAVVGAATAPVIFLCARHIFRNVRVAKLAAFFVAFFPSLVLWSSQGLKDGPIVFLLALVMLATLRLGEQFTARQLAALVLALFGLLSFRFYIFYMTAAASAGSFLVGMKPQTGRSLARQVLIVVAIGLSLTYLGVLRNAGSQLEQFGNLQAVQVSRADLTGSAKSGFGKDVDVSTTSGAVSAIPVGMLYLLFAPFPWQVTNLRQSITLPEMLVWWACFPLLCLGVWFTLKYRMRQALPILLFTTMLTLAYSVFQGNVGTAYRQRSQILVFYFIFVGVGYVLLRERREEAQVRTAQAKQVTLQTAQVVQAQRRYERWKLEREQELEEIARRLSERIDF